MALFIVNCTFEGGDVNEVIDANPVLVQDWIDAGFVTEIDAHGNRLTPLGDSE